MKTLMEQLGGFRFNKSLAFNVAQSGFDRVLLFERADEVRLAAWSFGGLEYAIELPASRDAMTVVRTDGTKAEQIANQDGNRFGIKYKPDADPAYLRFQKPNDLLRIAAAVTRLPLELVFDTPGQSPQFSIGFTNILSMPLSARLGMPDRFRELLLCAPTDMQKQLVPVGTRFGKRFATQSSSRQANGVPLLLGFEIAPSLETHINENVAIYQNVRLAPSLPVRASRLPGPAEDVVVKIENPSGQFWNGTIQAFAEGWKGGSRRVSEKVELTLPKDVATVIAHIPLIKEEKRDISWTRVIGISLASPNGSVCDVPVPDTRIVKLDVTNVEILPDGDSKTEAVPAAGAEPPANGAVAQNVPTLRLKYSFSADRKFYRVINPSWPPPGETGLIENPKFLGLWIYGDGLGCVPRMRFMDSTEQVFQSSGPKIDWKGWRQVFLPMQSTPEKLLECWGGEDDGKIHYPIEFDSIFLIDNVSRGKLDGEIFISAPTLIYGQ